LAPEGVVVDDAAVQPQKRIAGADGGGRRLVERRHQDALQRLAASSGDDRALLRHGADRKIAQLVRWMIPVLEIMADLLEYRRRLAVVLEHVLHQRALAGRDLAGGGLALPKNLALAKNMRDVGGLADRQQLRLLGGHQRVGGSLGG